MVRGKVGDSFETPNIADHKRLYMCGSVHAPQYACQTGGEQQQRTIWDLVGIAMPNPEASLEDIDHIVIREQAAAWALDTGQQHLQLRTQCMSRHLFSTKLAGQHACTPR